MINFFCLKLEKYKKIKKLLKKKGNYGWTHYDYL